MRPRARAARISPASSSAAARCSTTTNAVASRTGSTSTGVLVGAANDIEMRAVLYPVGFDQGFPSIGRRRRADDLSILDGRAGVVAHGNGTIGADVRAYTVAKRLGPGSGP